MHGSSTFSIQLHYLNPLVLFFLFTLYFLAGSHHGRSSLRHRPLVVSKGAGASGAPPGGRAVAVPSAAAPGRGPGDAQPAGSGAALSAGRPAAGAALSEKTTTKVLQKSINFLSGYRCTY